MTTDFYALMTRLGLRAYADDTELDVVMEVLVKLDERQTRLEDQVTRLRERLEGTLEVNQLWDGS